MNKLLIFSLFFVSFTIGQNLNNSGSGVTGIVIDENNNPIPYVTITVKGEKAITNSETDGNFKIVAIKSQNLILSAVGFETKTVNITDSKNIVLKKVVFELSEVVVKPKKRTSVTIGKYNGVVRYSGGNVLTGKAFPISDQLKTHSFLKSITFYSENEIDSAKLNIMVKGLNPDGSPGKNLLSENLIIKISKGNKNTTVDMENFFIEMPENGLFVCIEALKIEENKLYRDYEYQDEKGIHKFKSISYQPTFGFLPSTENRTWYFENGKWVQHPINLIQNPKSFSNILMKKYHEKYLDLPISLKLTN